MAQPGGEIDQGPQGELILRCSCGSEHFLSLCRWDVDDGAPYGFSLVETWRDPRGLWGRLSAAWRIFRRGVPFGVRHAEPPAAGGGQAVVRELGPPVDEPEGSCPVCDEELLRASLTVTRCPICGCWVHLACSTKHETSHPIE
jgi:hypothetical protein